MNTSLVPILLAMAARAAEQGTLVDIVQTFAKLVRLVEPLIAAAKPDGAAGH